MPEPARLVPKSTQCLRRRNTGRIANPANSANAVARMIVRVTMPMTASCGTSVKRGLMRAAKTTTLVSTPAAIDCLSVDALPEPQPLAAVPE